MLSAWRAFENPIDGPSYPKRLSYFHRKKKRVTVHSRDEELAVYKQWGVTEEDLRG